MESRIMRAAKIKAVGLYCADYTVKLFCLNDLKAKADALLK
jgi:hypothetical protein